MNTYKGFIKYQMTLYFKSYKFISTLMVLAMFLFLMYDQPSGSIVTSYMMTMTLVFVLSACTACAYTRVENHISEQLMILALKSDRKYYFLKILCGVSIGVVLSLISVIFPLIKNVLRGFSLFAEPIQIADVFMALIMHICFAYMGTSLGSIFHPRVMENRNEASAVVLILTIISIAKHSLNDNFTILKYVTWILPPVTDFIVYIKETGFEKIILMMGISFLYGTILYILGTKLLIRNKF